MTRTNYYHTSITMGEREKECLRQTRIMLKGMLEDIADNDGRFISEKTCECIQYHDINSAINTIDVILDKDLTLAIER